MKVHRPKRSVLALTLATTLLALAACGGGGGGGGETAAPAPSPGDGKGPDDTSAGTLAFDANNAGRVAGYPLWASASVLAAGHANAEDARALLRAGVAQDELACNPGGRVLRSWVDVDGNGVAGPGDRVQLVYERCARQGQSANFNGRVTLTLESFDAANGFAARWDLAAPGLAFETQGTADVALQGEARLQWSRTPAREALEVTGSGDQVLQLPFAGLTAAADRLSEFRLTKQLRWDEARTLVEVAMRFDSPELGGSFGVRTTAPLRAWFDRQPEPFAGQGGFEMRGRNQDTVRVTVANGGGQPTGTLALALDARGDGSVEATGSGDWSAVTPRTSHFFADTSPAGGTHVQPYQPDEFQLRSLPWGIRPVPVDSVLPLQFTRPVADAAWRWRLVELGRVEPFPSGDASTEVPVAVERVGALVLVKPLQPLRHSHRYELRLDTGEVQSGQMLVRATTGEVMAWSTSGAARFETPDVLNPRASFFNDSAILTPAETGQVEAAPQPDGAPPVSYRWRQIDGTPVLLDTPDARTSTVRLAGPGQGIGTARLQLTMALASGESASTEVVVRTMHDTTGAWFSALRAPENFPTPEFPPRLVTAWSGPATGRLEARVINGHLVVMQTESAQPDVWRYRDWRLEFASGDGSPLVPGRYTNASSALHPGRVPGSPLVEFLRAGVLMWPAPKEFTVHELETDATGQVTRLAIDVRLESAGGGLPTTGSVRLGSSRPPAF